MEYVTKKELQDNYPTKGEVAVVYATKVSVEESEERLIAKIRSISDGSINNVVERIFIQMRSDMEKHISSLKGKFRNEVEASMNILRDDLGNDTEMRMNTLRDNFKGDMEMQTSILSDKFKNDVERYMGSLNEDYQSRLSVVAEGVTGTWEKCERKYTELGEVDRKLETRVERIESVIVLYDTSGKVKNGNIAGRRIRKHAGKGQAKRDKKEQ